MYAGEEWLYSQVTVERAILGTKRVGLFFHGLLLQYSTVQTKGDFLMDTHYYFAKDLFSLDNLV